MASSIKYIAKFMLHLVIAISLATSLMIAVYALPTSPILEHAKEFPELIKGEKALWFETNMSQNSPHATLDVHTDSLMILNAIYPIDNSAIQAAMLNPRWLGRDESPINTLIDVLDGDFELTKKSIDRENPSWGRVNGVIDWDNNIVFYPRYWHGYLTILKPTLIFANVQEIIVINSYLQFLLMMAAILLFHQKLGLYYSAAFILILLTMNPITMAQSFQFYAVFYIMLISIILIMWQNQKIVDRGLYPFFFFWIGIFTAFLDFLTAPIVTLGLPLTVYFLLNQTNVMNRLGGGISFI